MSRVDERIAELRERLRQLDAARGVIETAALEGIRREAEEELARLEASAAEPGPEAAEGPAVLLQAIAAFVGELGGASRVLVTARPYAYAEKRWHLEGFEILALAPFSEAQVARFVAGWYHTAARRAFGWSEATARAKGKQLRDALGARPYLGDLASRPLLLTLMATLHSSWGQLPEDRADLYEESVKLLLGRWQRGPAGAADLAGNVWEWTTTIWSRSSVHALEAPYPYQAGDAREDLEGGHVRVLRGGSWFHDSRAARCAARNRLIAVSFFNTVGFRVVLSLADSES